MSDLENKCVATGVYHVKHYRDGVLIDEFEAKNNVPTAALNNILDTWLSAATPATGWYIGMFEGNYTPVSTDTAATFPALATETSAYVETSRQVATFGSSAGGAKSNAGSPANFTMNATKTIYGAFLTTSSTKGSTTGLLGSAIRFPASKSVVATDTLAVTYSLTIVSA